MLTRLLLAAAACLALVSSVTAKVPVRPKTPWHYNYHTLLEQKYELGLVKRPQASGNVTEWQLEQPLDHYDRTNKGKYNQTYWTNEQFFDPTNPVGFIFLGGEWQESGDTLEYGANAMTDWAKRFNGLMVDIQHRYYDGIPAFEEGKPEQIKYLSSVQSLADAARVIQHLNEKYAPQLKAPIKWISMGGSYAGNMAAWFRLRYPELTVGSFAISGPVEAIVDYTGFFSVEGHDLTPSCLNFTRQAVAELDSYLDDPKKGWAKVQSDFGIKFANKLDIGVWAFSLAWDVLSSGGICDSSNQTATPYQVLVMNAPGGGQTVNYTAETVWSLYGWLWYRQTCTEMGYYQTGTDFDTNPLQPITKYLDPLIFKQACKDAYGYSFEQTEENIAWTNVAYGGKNITTTNTFFTHGNADGWSAAGVTDMSHPIPVSGNQVFVIDKGTHCSDLYWPDESDSPSLKAARAAQIAQIKKWLS